MGSWGGLIQIFNREGREEREEEDKEGGCARVLGAASGGRKLATENTKNAEPDSIP